MIQRPLARDASWEDVVADAIGVVLALAVYAMFEKRSPLRRWHRFAALVVAISCVAIFVMPIVRMTRAYVHRNGQFPVLADFHSRIELYWTLSVGVQSRDRRRRARGGVWRPKSFPGVAFHEPVPDWRRYKTLAIDVENPAAEPLKLVVRVHDRRHNRMFNDRFNRNFTLARGASAAPCGSRSKTSAMRLEAGSWIWRICRTSHCLRALPRVRCKLRIHSLRLE